MSCFKQPRGCRSSESLVFWPCSSARMHFHLLLGACMGGGTWDASAFSRAAHSEATRTKSMTSSAFIFLIVRGAGVRTLPGGDKGEKEGSWRKKKGEPQAGQFWRPEHAWQIRQPHVWWMNEVFVKPVEMCAESSKGQTDPAHPIALPLRLGRRCGLAWASGLRVRPWSWQRSANQQALLDALSPWLSCRPGRLWRIESKSQPSSFWNDNTDYRAAGSPAGAPAFTAATANGGYHDHPS